MTHGLTEADVRKLISEADFMADYGFQLAALHEGDCTLEVPYRPRFDRPGGVVSGPVFMAAADAAMWFAIMTRTPRGEMWVTAGMQTAFLDAARRETFQCRARVLTFRKRSAYGVAECTAPDGRLLTHHTITYARVVS